MDKKSDESLKVIRCPVCEAVNYDHGGEIHCHRCDSRIYRNPKTGIGRTWALLITAILLYIPANIYPILDVKSLIGSRENTIIDGVIALWDQGSYPVAIIILVSSVFVPILKFVLLSYLLIRVRHPVPEGKALRHKIYYVTEVIGPWSMIDVFVVSILTGLIHFESFKILAGPGATAFVLMVFFTMLAALSFDPRWIREYDPTQKYHPKEKA